MPYLKVSTNVAIDQQQSTQLPGELSKLMSQQTGKPERYVMVELSGSQAMLFAGSDAPLAYLECKSIGLNANQVKSLASSLTTALSSALNISADRIYVEFTNCPAEHWAWNGSTFG
jgi:phenylpyruvate tautomerase PptA (4-oxalocrotonate tautomerase family)